jgi:hypothetical protein
LNQRRAIEGAADIANSEEHRHGVSMRGKQYEGSSGMSCATCDHLKDVDEAGGPYVVRKCAECGRAMKVREAGKHGIGIQIRKGDEFVMPAEWLRLASAPPQSKRKPLKARLGLVRQLGS